MEFVNYEDCFVTSDLSYLTINSIILPIIYTDSGLRISLCLSKEEWIEASKMYLKYVDDDYIKYMFADLPVTKDLVKNFFLNFNYVQNCTLNGGYGDKLLYVVYNENEMVGSIGVVDECDNYYLALFIDKLHSGKGYGNETVKTILTMLKQNFINYTNNINNYNFDTVNFVYPKPVIWRCNHSNYASVKIAEKNGFIQTANGVYPSGSTYMLFEKNLLSQE